VSVPARPAPLFADPGYRAHGQIFWPDFLFDEANEWTIKPFAWEFLGLVAFIAGIFGAAYLGIQLLSRALI